MEVSLAIVYSIRNTRAPPWSYPPTTGNGIFLLYRRIHLCLLKLLETKNTLPLLIVLPLNMVSAVGKISRRLPAESTRILLPFPRRFGVTFSGFLIFKIETQRKRSECEHFHELCKAAYLRGNQTCNSLCWKCRPKRCSMYCPDFTPRLCQKFKKSPPTCVMTALRYATVPTTSISTGPIMPTIFTVKQNLLHGLGLTRLLSPWNSWTVWFPLCFCSDSLCPISLLLIRNPSLVL